jgi:hypothetical protein
VIVRPRRRSAAEHVARLARLAAEHRIAVERDRDDVGVDRPAALRLERGERRVEPARSASISRADCPRCISGQG